MFVSVLGRVRPLASELLMSPSAPRRRPSLPLVSASSPSGVVEAKRKMAAAGQPEEETEGHVTQQE